jgi:hypothetical protein
MNAFPVGSTLLSLCTQLLMHTQQNGTRVFYWDVNGTIKYGTVQSTSRMTDVGVYFVFALVTCANAGYTTGDPSGQRQSRRRVYR